MTLIAVHCQPDRVDAMTDSARYNQTYTYCDTGADKALTFPHLRAVALSGGSVPAGVVWDHTIAKLASAAHTFDELVTAAPAALKVAIRHGHMHAYLAGWSHVAGRFTAYVLAPLENYVADLSDTLHVRPAPAGVERTDAERVAADYLRQASEFGRYGGDADDWPVGEVLEPPAGDEGWAALARRIHEERASIPLSTGRKIVIGGTVTLTTITPDGVDQREVHRFTPADFRRVVAGTLHPFGQVGPCPCGSGKRYVLCHIPQWLTLPCLCESGKTLGECCALTAPKVGALLEQHPELRDLEPAAGLVTH